MSQFDDLEEPETQASRRPRHASRVPDEVGEDIHQRLAAMSVRRWSNRHACDATPTTPCTHPNHRRDADSLLSVDPKAPGALDMLGLDHSFPTVTDAERRTWLRWIAQSGPAEDNLAA